MQRLTILFLTAIGGFVDTATFVSAKGLFAAHVTGNFVVFGAALAKGVTPEDYVKLIAFPLFVLSVSLGVIIQRYFVVLLLECVFIGAVCVASYFFPHMVNETVLVMALVAAMGVQNSLHRHAPGPMTTVMTGTVMNWAAQATERIFSLETGPSEKKTTPSMTGTMMIFFVSGCVASGFLTYMFNLKSLIFPAIILVFLVFYELLKKDKTQQSI
jgi:uncharacterized membrane protein YoaK (UPF0700 family)